MAVRTLVKFRTASIRVMVARRSSKKELFCTFVQSSSRDDQEADIDKWHGRIKAKNHPHNILSVYRRGKKMETKHVHITKS